MAYRKIKDVQRKGEIRVFISKETEKKIDRDIPLRGQNRSEVVRTIVEDYYCGNLTNIKGLETLVNKIKGGK